eukprot:sb/3466462/
MRLPTVVVSPSPHRVVMGCSVVLLPVRPYSMVEEPVTQFALLGSTLSFTCAGTGTPTILWMKGEEKGPLSVYLSISVSLFFLSLSLSLSLYADFLFLKFSSILTVDNHKYPHNRTPFHFDKQYILIDEDLVSTGSPLLLTNVSTTEEGLYTCRLSYPEGNITSSPAQLLCTRQWQLFFITSHAQLSKDLSQVASSKEALSSLDLMAPLVEHCVVHVVVSRRVSLDTMIDIKISLSLTLSLTLSPSLCVEIGVSEDPTAPTAVLGNTAWFQCNVTGTVEPEFYWTRNDVIISESELFYGVLRANCDLGEMRIGSVQCSDRLLVKMVYYNLMHEAGGRVL